MQFASEYIYAQKRAERCIAGPRVLPRDYDPDTNVISAQFDHLVDTRNTHAGDPISCGNCDAIFSKLSKLSERDPVNKKRLWKCEFCNFENKILIEDEEVPTDEEVTYILEPAPLQDSNQASNTDGKYLIYCIDVSGSMSVTTEVNSNFKLPTDELKIEQNRNIGGEFYRPQRKHVRHVTRLESVQVAIDHNLTELEKNEPGKKVGIVSFNQAVNVIGDGKMNLIKIDGDGLDSKDKIRQVADRTSVFENIKENKKILREKLLRLEEGGATALGPALYYSILVASRKQGSQVILCTDGLANKGIGNLDNTNEEEIAQFYSDVTELALLNGVSVSIITIEGTNCKLGLLGDIANRTGGAVIYLEIKLQYRTKPSIRHIRTDHVKVVNPLNLKEEFSSILDEPVIATNVTATLILHKALYIKDHENFNNKQSVITKKIGNVTKETEITFEFSVRDDVDLDTKNLPFQLKIVYNALDGTKTLRVLSKLKTLTDDKEVAEKHADRRILASNVAQTQTRLAQISSGNESFQKYSSYIRKIAPIREDNFCQEAYNRVENDLLSVIKTSSESSRALARLPNPASGSSTNAFSTIDDQNATQAYKMSRLKAKDLSKDHKK